MSPIRVRRAVSCALFLLAFISFQSLAEVTSLVVDPQSPSTVYAGTAEGGVFKSADGGGSWARAGLTDTPVYKLAIDPGAPSFLYALTSTGLLKSVNGGETWDDMLMNGSLPDWGMIQRPSSWTVSTLALARRTDPALPATVYAGVTYMASDWYTDYVWGEVFTTTAGGQGWDGFLYFYDPFATVWISAPIMAAAEQTDTTRATLYTSTHPAAYGYQICGLPDGACTRIDQSPEEPSVLVVDPHNPRVVYAGINGTGVYKSSDAGVTWSGGGGSGMVRALVPDPLTPGTLYAATDDQSVLKSTDGGVTWTAANAGLEPGGVRALTINPLTPAILYAATTSGVFKSTDGGASWSPTGLQQRLRSVSVPRLLKGGTAGTGRVILNAPAPGSGAVVALSSSNPALASVPANVTVAAGATSASFPISTVPVSEGIPVIIFARLDGLGTSAYLVVATRRWNCAGCRADFDGNARSDVLWRNRSTGENYLYPMSGTTILPDEGYLRTVADPDWRIAGVGDFDGDGRADILWRNGATGENYMYFMSGTSIAGEGYVRTVPDQNWHVAGVGDFDGDGRDDILWRNGATGENYVYLMNGIGIVGEGYLRTVPDLDWRVASVGDFDGDTKADILWRNAATGENHVYLMNGMSIASEGYLRTVTNLDWKVASVGDFDGDGSTDIAWRNSSSGENYIYLMQGTNIVGEGYLRTVADLAWQIVASGDYDGDGKSDLLWRHSSTGENYLYPMDGTAIKPTEGYVRTVPTESWNVAIP